MKLFKYFTVIALILVFSLPVFAHPGSTDEYGGHVDWTTGEYHYHHGFEAHYHTNGVCPYEFKDYADHTNHGSTSNNNYIYNYGDRDQYVPAVQYTLKPSPTPNPKPDTQSKPSKQKDNFLFVLIISGLLVTFYYHWIKHREEKSSQRLLAQKNFEEEKAKYTQLYGGKDILKVINAPPTAFIDSSGLPHQSVKNDDIFVIYLAPKQPRVYHRHKGCGKNLHKDNYINLRHYNRTITPCKKCCPTVPDTTWYYEYLKVKRIKKAYDID